MTMQKGITKRALFTTFVASMIFVMTGCSSGGSNSGTGVNVTGTYSGNLIGSSGGAVARITLSLSQGAGSLEDGVFTAEVTGLGIVANSCMTGGTISGNVVAGRVSGTAGEIEFSASQTGAGLRGIWSFAGSESCPANSGTFLLN